MAKVAINSRASEIVPGERPARRRRWWLWMLLAMGAAALALPPALLAMVRILHPHAGPRNIRVSPETTHVTELVDSYGRVDFLESINHETSRDITADNNAAVPLLRAIGPPVDEVEVCERLEMKTLPPESAEYFVPFEAFLEKTRPDLYDDESAAGDEEQENAPKIASAAEVDERLRPLIAARDWKGFHQQFAAAMAERPLALSEVLYLQCEVAQEIPWQAAEFPDVAAWLTANEAALEMVAEAAQYERFFHPLVTPARHAAVLDAQYRHRLLELLSVGEALCACAMLRVGAGDRVAAWSDLVVAFRLSRLVGQHPFAIGLLIGARVEGEAIAAGTMLVHSSQPDAAFISQMQADLVGLPPRSRLAEKMNFAERLKLLDAIVSVAHDGDEGGAHYPENSAGDVQRIWDRQIVNWNNVLRDANIYFDGLTRDLSFSDLRQREQLATARFQSVVQRFNIRADPQLDLSGLLDGAPREQALLSTIAYISSLGENGTIQSDADAQVQFQLFVHALAIAKYRHEHGALPTSLAALSPDDWQSRYADPFAAGPLIYAADADGSAIYSVGHNGVDDRGRSRDEALNAPQQPDGSVVSRDDYDVIVRLPPHFNLARVGLPE